jgi:hypothetical protein
MGSRQNAVKGFLDVVFCDDTMLDRWIPDEDWVRQIQDNGEHDCSIINLNRGMTAQCMWQNNHASLQGARIFYNKKNVRTSKSKATNKVITFYYVMSANSPAPTVPSDQGFYQSLWDDPARSNRQLKRMAPQAKPSSSRSNLPAKKTKTRQNSLA